MKANWAEKVNTMLNQRDNRYNPSISILRKLGGEYLQKEHSRRSSDVDEALQDVMSAKECAEAFCTKNVEYKAAFEAIKANMGGIHAGSKGFLLDILEDEFVTPDCGMGYSVLFRYGMCLITLSLAENRLDEIDQALWKYNVDCAAKNKRG